ncbi:MAG: MFS transporter [Xanthomonadales bacterium]|nr:putative symporter YjmB [Xanthomonadales bacterium]MCC6593247.1 MFS transporter [Xanthomonadales bacterium]
MSTPAPTNGNTRVHIPFARLTAYSTLQLPLAMAALPVVLNVAHYYGEVLKLSLAVIGPILIASRVIDAIQDPIIGFLSDRLTHRKNGRLLLVAGMVPLLLVGFFMLFDPPAMFHPAADGGSPNMEMLGVWLFVSLLLVHLGYAGVSISYHALGAELSDDYDERTRVTVGREVFGLTGMMLAVVLPTILTARFGEASGYQWLGILYLPIAIAAALPTLLYSPPSVHGPVMRPPGHSILGAFFAPLGNPLYRRLLVVFIVNGSALGIAVSVMLFYVEHVLGGGKLQAGLILLAYFVSGAASVPLWMYLSRHLSKAAAWFVGIVLTAVAMASAALLGEGDIGLFIAISAITGLGLGADYGLPPAILADVINAKEGRETRGATGAYFGLWALSTKLATAIGAAASLPILDALGFNPGNGRYDTHALVIVYIVLPVAVKILAGALLWFVRIEAERPEVAKVLWK